MPEEELLPKPQTDLPLPEKDLPTGRQEIPAHLASQGVPLRSYGGKNIFRNKIFILFLVISFLVAFLIGGFALGRNSVLKELNPSNPVPPPPNEPVYEESPTPLPAANWEITNSTNTIGWKKYLNSDLGYSFEAPADWQIVFYNLDDDNIGSPNLRSPDYELRERSRPSGAEIGITKRKTNEKDVKNEFTKPHGGGEYTNLTYQIVDGNSAIRYEHNWEGYGTITSTIKDGYLYQIAIGSDNNLTPYLTTYNQIISTFKFTDSEEAED